MRPRFALGAPLRVPGAPLRVPGAPLRVPGSWLRAWLKSRLAQLPRPAAALALLALQGCVTANVDEFLYEGPGADLGDTAVVVLGRRHASEYDTEPEFIDCISTHIATDRSLRVIPEPDFQDALYPWFEPRTAPLRPEGLGRLQEIGPVREKLAELNTGYIVWVDGKTERTEGTGSMTCTVAPGIAGCFGFGTWGDDAEYEAVIWDFKQRREVGRMNAKASGQSYMPSLVVPIPIIAPVKETACAGLGQQLQEFFSAES